MLSSSLSMAKAVEAATESKRSEVLVRSAAAMPKVTRLPVTAMTAATMYAAGPNLDLDGVPIVFLCRTFPSPTEEAKRNGWQATNMGVSCDVHPPPRFPISPGPTCFVTATAA
jgi:hypothetical protein